MTPETASRQRWMGVLARAGNRLGDYEQQLMDAEFQLIRPAEIGMTMVRGRMGGTGAAFNLGEMTVTRCVVRFADGRTGYSMSPAATSAMPSSLRWPMLICRAAISSTG